MFLTQHLYSEFIWLEETEVAKYSLINTCYPTVSLLNSTGVLVFVGNSNERKGIKGPKKRYFSVFFSASSSVWENRYYSRYQITKWKYGVRQTVNNFNNIYRNKRFMKITCNPTIPYVLENFFF